MTGGWRSGQVASAAGVNLETLRYYERRGLLEEPHRTLGGHRLYPPETVTVLRLIKTAQRLGFTLDEVAELLSVGTYQPGRRPDAGLQHRARIKLAEIEEKIANLATIRDTLRQALAAGCDDLIACAESPCCPLPFADLATGNGSATNGRLTASDQPERVDADTAQPGSGPVRCCGPGSTEG